VHQITPTMSVPKGKLIIIGGSVDKGSFFKNPEDQPNNLKFFEKGILKRISTESHKGIHSRIEIITTASSIPKEVGEEYVKAFEQLDIRDTAILDVRSREEANAAETLDRLKKADVVMFTGGDQLRLTSIFGGTEFLDIVHERYINDYFIIAGTSAGAMAMSNTMIYEGNATKAHLKGEVKITTGLGFMDNVIIDSHFEKRGRFGRLAQAVAANPGCIGIGLGEDTGMLITEGNKMQAIGSGMVMIIDGHHIKHSNIADIPDGNPISVENLKVHLCENGNGYWVNERKFVVEMKEGALIEKQVHVE